MNQPLGILHVISQLDGYGAARMVRRLAARQAAGGDRVTVVAFRAATPVVEELRRAGVEVHVLNRRWGWDVIVVMRQMRLRRRMLVDVVHAWDAETLGYLLVGGWGAKPQAAGRARALVATVERAPRTFAGAKAIQWGWRRVGMFATGNDATRAWLVRQGVEGDRVRVIPPGVPPHDSHDRALSRERLLAALALPENAELVAIAGPLRRDRSLDEAIWAFELVRVLHERARLLVLGDGPDRRRLEQFASQVSEPGCVRFLGYRDDLADVLRHADVYWQPDEALSTPLALLEALAAGVPVVASDVPAHRAAIVDGVNGRLAAHGSRADFARATDELLNNLPLARQLAAAAAHDACRLGSLDAALAAYAALYRQALGDSGRRLRGEAHRR